MLAAGEIETDDAEHQQPAPEPEPEGSGRARNVGLSRLEAIARANRAAGIGVQEFGLLAENLPVFQLWCEIQTAWRIAPSGHPVGISWADVRAHPATRRVKRKDREDVLEGVAVMERAWLAKRSEIDKERASA